MELSAMLLDLDSSPRQPRKRAIVVVPQYSNRCIIKSPHSAGYDVGESASGVSARDDQVVSVIVQRSARPSISMSEAV